MASTQRGSASQKSTVLLIGSTGNIGRYLTTELQHHSDSVKIRYVSRHEQQVQQWREEGRDAVFLDLDIPSSFPYALVNVDCVFLLTTYTVSMLTQSKTLIDAAKKAGVSHIVHLGIFADWDTTVPHYTWHQLIEYYIKASGISWTLLHPNMYYDNLLTPKLIAGTTFLLKFGTHRAGWVAAEDVARVAATVLMEGEGKHGGKEYWMSSETLSGQEVARTLSEVLDVNIRAEVLEDEDWLKPVGEKVVWKENVYAYGVREFARQIRSGQLASYVKDDATTVTGTPSLNLRQWAEKNRQQLLIHIGTKT